MFPDAVKDCSPPDFLLHEMPPLIDLLSLGYEAATLEWLPYNYVRTAERGWRTRPS